MRSCCRCIFFSIKKYTSRSVMSRIRKLTFRTPHSSTSLWTPHELGRLIRTLCEWNKLQILGYESTTRTANNRSQLWIFTRVAKKTVRLCFLPETVTAEPWRSPNEISDYHSTALLNLAHFCLDAQWLLIYMRSAAHCKEGLIQTYECAIQKIPTQLSTVG